MFWREIRRQWLSSQSIMVNRFNVALFESIWRYSVWFNWLTIIAKHHGQSVQRHLDRIDTMQFGSIQLTHYHRKIMVNRFNVTLIESIRCYSVRFNWLTIIARQHGKSIRYHSNPFNWLTILSKHRIQSISQPLHRLFVIILARSVLHTTQGSHT